MYGDMEQEIWDLLARGQYRAAFELLMPRFQQKVFRLCWSIVGDRAIAEEVAQEVFFRVWKALPSWRGEASLSTWIYAIARNTSVSALDPERKRKTVVLDAAALRSAQRGGPEPPERRLTDVEQLLAQLPENYRAPVRLFYLEDKSYEEVAAMLALPLGTVKTYLHRARKELARTMERVRP